MKVTQCDKCGAIEENPSRFIARKRCEIFTDGECHMELRSFQYDLCEKCANEIYKLITGFDMPRKVL